MALEVLVFALFLFTFRPSTIVEWILQQLPGSCEDSAIDNLVLLTIFQNILNLFNCKAFDMIMEVIKVFTICKSGFLVIPVKPCAQVKSFESFTDLQNRLSAKCTCEIRHTLNIVVVSSTTDFKHPQNLNHSKDTAAAVNTGEADCS